MCYRSSDGVADGLTGRNIGDFGADIINASITFNVDPALVEAFGLIEQGYTGSCRGCIAVLEEAGGDGYPRAYTQITPLTQNSDRPERRVIDSALRVPR